MNLRPSILSGSLALSICLALSGPAFAKEAGEAKADDAKPKVKRTANGETAVTLNAETQKRVGLALEPLAAATITPEVKAYGRVVDPTALAAMVTELANAELAAKVSAQEFEQTKLQREAEINLADTVAKNSSEELKRTKALYEQNNASTRTLQTAEVNAKRDQLLLETQKLTSNRAVQTAEAAATRDRLAAENTRSRMILAWGLPALSEKDWPTTIRSFSLLESSLVRVELPAGEDLNPAPGQARLIPVSDESSSAVASLIGALPVSDPQTQGQAFMYLVKPSSPVWRPGVAVTAYLKKSDTPLTGVIIPRSAILRADGKTWVYVQAGENDFVRREVSLIHPLANGWFATEGVKAKEMIVVTGAAQIRSEELNHAGALVNGLQD